MVRPAGRGHPAAAIARAGDPLVSRGWISGRAALEAARRRGHALFGSRPLPAGEAMSLRVLHAPAEIAGQASILAKALRDLGVDAHSLAYNPGFPQYTPDEMRPYDACPVIPRYAGYLGSFLRHAGRYDVYHFHFGRTLVPAHSPDLHLYHALGQKVVFHYHGCDIRDRAHMLAPHPHATCTECDPFCVPPRQRMIRAAAARFADAELVSTPDLLESAPRAQHLPVAADLSNYP